MARAPPQSWGSRPSLLGTDVVITETNRVTSGQCSGRSSGGGFTPLGFCVQCGIAHFEQSDFWSQTNWTSALQAQAIALAKAGEDQAREAIQQISGQGVNWHGKLQSTSSSALAAAFQGAAQQLLCLGCGSEFSKLLAALIIFLHFFQITHFPSNTVFALNIWRMQISLFTHAWKNSDSAVFPG